MNAVHVELLDVFEVPFARSRTHAAAVRVDVTGVDGVERRSSRDSERHLETVVVTVVVPRTAYQAPGSEDLHPMDAALNLPR